MLNCTKCGFDNELGRIFCHQCGAKLDLDQIKPPSRGGKKIYRKGSMFSARRAIRIVIDLLVVGAVVGAIYLLAQVPAVRSMPTGPDVARPVSKKRVALETMIARHQAGSIDLGEVELNAYLDQFDLDYRLRLVFGRIIPETRVSLHQVLEGFVRQLHGRAGGGRRRVRVQTGGRRHRRAAHSSLGTAKYLPDGTVFRTNHRRSE